MRNRMNSFCMMLAAVLLAASRVQAQRLPTGQILSPAGHSIDIEGTFAANIVRIPRKSWVAVVCSGARQSLSIVDFKSRKVLSSTQFQQPNKTSTGYVATGSVYYGIAVAPDGKTLYAAHGSQDSISSYTLGDDGSLILLKNYAEPLTDPRAANFPSGVAIDPSQSTLYAANNMSDSLAVFSMADPSAEPTLYPVHSYPLAVAYDKSSDNVYVSSERDSCLSVLNCTTKTISSVMVGSHPDSLLLSADGSILYVANGDSDSISILNTTTNQVVRTLLLRPASVGGLPGATPTGLALSPDQKTLYVALADMDAVAVVKLSESRKDGAVVGYVPTGWYPTAITTSADGDQLVVANAKGSRAAVPNPGGPNPINHNNMYKDHNILTSTVSVIVVPTATELRADTRLVLSDNAISKPIDPQANADTRLLSSLPIKHVIYIIKENRTYDEVLGDMAQGDGDPQLVLFGKSVTPNLHAISDQFVLLDNFYCCAEVSPDGWNWSTSGLAEEYVQRTVPENYSEGRGGRPEVRDYDYEGENRNLAVSDRGMADVATSPGGYIWDAVAKSGLSYRDYGAFLSTDGDRPAKPALLGHTSMLYAPFDMKYADSDVYTAYHLPSPGQDPFVPPTVPSRFAAWEQEFDGYVQDGKLPAFELLRLPRDHTAGTSPGTNTPQAMAADNDYAVAEIVQAVSHSPYWESTAIFVLEDDAQNGPDHVDCHRSTAYVISPYIKRHSVDHRFYNTDSILRTMELLLHVRPMTRLDASAPPIGTFTSTPDITPYTAIVPDLTLVSSVNSDDEYGASLSKKMDFAVADDAPEQPLNEILWHSIKGFKPMPTPRNSVLGE